MSVNGTWTKIKCQSTHKIHLYVYYFCLYVFDHTIKHHMVRNLILEGDIGGGLSVWRRCNSELCITDTVHLVRWDTSHLLIAFHLSNDSFFASSQLDLNFFASYLLDCLSCQGLEREDVANTEQQPEEEESGGVNYSFHLSHCFLAQQHKDLTKKITSEHKKNMPSFHLGHQSISKMEYKKRQNISTHVTANRTGFT